MGEYVGISIGNYDFIRQKNTFGDLLSLFSPNELTIEDCIDEDGEKYERRYFTKTVRQAKRALDVMGHTLSHSQVLFEYELQTEIEYLRDDGEEEKINTLNIEFTFQLWVCAVKKYAAVVARDEYVDGHFPLLEKEQACNEAERKVYASLPFNQDETFFGIDLWYSDKTIGDYWDVFRVILEAFEDEEIVTLDYTNLYQGGWCNEYPEEDDYKASKTVVLTEGSTDARILGEAINVLYPDMSKYYSFIDFSTYDVQGSTNYLSHYLKAFVAAGIENRIIALYDNDSAGLAEIKNFEKMTFPDNVRIMHLPDLDFCVEYPTIGPSGNTNENINGRAGSIEMYVGKDILCNHGEYIPIRWKSYVDKVEAYQGEIISKSEVLKKFEEKAKKALKDGPILEEWNELDILLNAIFSAFFEDYG
ncbi:MAG: hypothetical protein E7304_11210 [Butyrivibrio sp.]|uniref:HEPN/Toprim-associated domain-containing protein n=1 Tax=Butyrivibrio sp. TaxID=28121 RepID=UPI001EC390DB|nr:HEPN/Toprim-associated domain-containing protein [Butyrivibrio sp.]MBE5841957.1 hypothetical protein [Butyrivibrio sp.]